MSRELDPDLFGQGAGSQPQPTNRGSFQSDSSRAKSHLGGLVGPSSGALGLEQRPADPRIEPGRAVPFPAIDLKVIEAQVTQMKVVMQQFDKRMDHLAARLGEVSRDSQARLDQYGQQLIRLEDGLSRLTKDTAERLATVVGRVNERRVQESKIQESMDRHNLLVRNFENRLDSLQKLASDQEQALLSAFAALEDARAELARLKRI